MVKYYELTRYPGIFKNTYWGSFTQSTKESIDTVMIEARNAFVEKYNVKKRCAVPLYVSEQLLLNDDRHDHTECYDAGSSYVVVSSPYGPPSWIPTGFVKSDKLYSNDANTFIAVVEKKTRRDRSPARK